MKKPKYSLGQAIKTAAEMIGLSYSRALRKIYPEKKASYLIAEFTNKNKNYRISTIYEFSRRTKINVSLIITALFEQPAYEQLIEKMYEFLIQRGR